VAPSLTISVENARFSYVFHSTQNLKMFPLHRIPNFFYTENLDTKLIIRLKSFPLRPNA